MMLKVQLPSSSGVDTYICIITEGFSGAMCWLQVTAITNKEELQMNRANLVPFLLETELKQVRITLTFLTTVDMQASTPIWPGS